MITKEQVQHVASLARIELNDEELKKFQKDLSEILDYFEILKKTHTSLMGEELYSLGVENTVRQDIPQKEKSEVIEKLISMAPQTEGGYVKVQKIL
jgi:aspartyl-tRNA(Asn)/glutamyl-tRNA(Gln) amidotransferase subunit C